MFELFQAMSGESVETKAITAKPTRTARRIYGNKDIWNLILGFRGLDRDARDARDWDAQEKEVSLFEYGVRMPREQHEFIFHNCCPIKFKSGARWIQCIAYAATHQPSVHLLNWYAIWWYQLTPAQHHRVSNWPNVWWSHLMRNQVRVDWILYECIIKCLLQHKDWDAQCRYLDYLLRSTPSQIRSFRRFARKARHQLKRRIKLVNPDHPIPRIVPDALIARMSHHFILCQNAHYYIEDTKRFFRNIPPRMGKWLLKHHLELKHTAPRWWNWYVKIQMQPRDLHPEINKAEVWLQEAHARSEYWEEACTGLSFCMSHWPRKLDEARKMVVLVKQCHQELMTFQRELSQLYDRIQQTEDLSHTLNPDLIQEYQDRMREGLNQWEMARPYYERWFWKTGEECRRTPE